MPRRNTNTLPAANKSKLAKPHILLLINDIIVGEIVVTEEMLNQILLHLRECEICLSNFEKIVEATVDETSIDAKSDSARRLLVQLKEANRMVQERNESIAAYAELIEVSGIEKAQERFPAFGQHLEDCAVCSAEVEEMRAALKQAVEAGLIDPLNER